MNMAQAAPEESVVSCELSDVVYTVVPNKRLRYRFIKRTFDILASLIGLILLSPLFLIVAIAIFIDDPGPVLFFQERNGLNGRVFRMWKFRSMYKDAPEKRFEMESQNELDGPAFKITNDPRVTRVGRLIRKASIDELPQLVNILRGQMSIVGPRPLPTYETAKLTQQQRKRLLAKPGLVCYWQVSGRNDIPFDEWMRMDYRYINEASILTDLKIICMAIPAVISGKGAE
jgi:lipopolysaccharide/colanic/teichoic acid biosynthesis glycosyltransferase